MNEVSDTLKDKFMKRNMLLFVRNAIQGGLFGLSVLTLVTASGQNLLRNPDFEAELGPDNWTIVYTGVSNSLQLAWPKTCTASDFVIQGRTRLGHKDQVGAGTWDGADGTGTNYWNKMGLHFKGNHDWQMHAYASQVVTGLVAGASYAASSWMGLFESDQPSKIQIYMEVLGGASGMVSKRSVYVTSIIKDNPNGWTQVVVTNTASDAGTIEIRLHYNKNASTTGEKWRNMDALYDHAALFLAGQPDYTPPYQVTSFTRDANSVSLTWETVMNTLYRIQMSTDIGDPNSWKLLGREWNMDPKYAATGTSFTFKTNLASLYYTNGASRNPIYLDPNVPVFFRISSQTFQP